MRETINCIGSLMVHNVLRYQGCVIPRSKKLRYPWLLWPSLGSRVCSFLHKLSLNLFCLVSTKSRSPHQSISS